MTRELHFLLADDDEDDRYFFDMALRKLPASSRLTMVENGEKLMNYLEKHSDQLPDVLFLDLNMPRKNGAECLDEIKSDSSLQHLPVIIYSTSLHNDMADLLYDKGAHYYIKKARVLELQAALQNVASLIGENKFVRPPRDQFIFNMVAA
jgi:CheY-like chemotaxis protein